MTETPDPTANGSEFERLLAAPYEQFDKRSELLASIEAYSKAVPATASAAPQAKNREWLENATYTAAEVKVLTEAALRLGRKEASEEIAAECEKRATSTAALADFGRNLVSVGLARGYSISAEVARHIASQPSLDATGEGVR